MFPKLLNAYKKQGYQFHIGNNNCLCSCLVKDGVFSHTGGGIGVTDIAFFFALSKIFIPKRILCVGNAAGYGTFVLAEIFDCPIDVIDAEVEGECNPIGSELTRSISNEFYHNRVQLKIGFCPEDLHLFNFSDYDLIFLDGQHTNEQHIKDYRGLIKVAASSSIMYLHDVDLLQMEDSWQVIKNNDDSFRGYNVDFSAFGCKALVRNLPIVENWLKMIECSPLEEHRNPIATLRATVIVQPQPEDQ